jgi:hypothetical protein
MARVVAVELESLLVISVPDHRAATTVSEPMEAPEVRERSSFPLLCQMLCHWHLRQSVTEHRLRTV